MKLLKTILLLLLINSAMTGQNHDTDFIEISPDKLKQDLHLLKFNLEAVHPGLYTYTSKSEFEAFFAETEKKIDKPMTKLSFYRLMLPLNNKIRNGHTLIIPPESWSQFVASEAIHIPFDIFTVHDKLFILRNFTEENTIEEGDELISIDGIPAKLILEKMLNASNKDGYSETYPLRIINQDFSEYYANIIDAKTEYAIQLKRKDAIFNYKIKAKSIEEIRKIAKEKYQFDKRPWYAGIENPPFSYNVENKIAILTLPTFNIDNIKDTGINYKSFFKNTFKDINEQKVKALIIDLRGNGGGHGDVGVELFSYLQDKPFKLIKDMYAITRKIPNKKYYSGNLFWQSIQMKLALKKINNTKYIPRKSAAKRNNLTLDTKQASFPTYKGALYVLTDGWVFSASAMFAGLVKNDKRGIFIGEETGGNPKVQIGDFEQMLTLPNSALRLRIPLFYEEMDLGLENTKRGIIPDYYQGNNILQEINKEDQVLNWTIIHIQNKLKE